MRQNPHVRICGGPGSATTLVYPTARHRARSRHCTICVTNDLRIGKDGGGVSGQTRCRIRIGPPGTSEATDAVPLDAHIVSKRVVRKPPPIYEGTGGEQLARAPRSQRRNWTDEQWGAYEEHRRLVADQSKDNAPVASVVVIRSEREGPTSQAVAGGLPGVPRVAHTRSKSSSSVHAPLRQSGS